MRVKHWLISPVMSLVVAASFVACSQNTAPSLSVRRQTVVGRQQVSFGNWVEKQLLAEPLSFERFHFDCFDNADVEFRPVYWFQPSGDMNANLLRTFTTGSATCDAYDVETQLNAPPVAEPPTPWIYQDSIKPKR